jgi:hypothetical protein
MVKIWSAKKSTQNWYMGQDDRWDCHNACYFMGHMYYTAGCNLLNVNGGKEISCWNMHCNLEVTKWFIVCRWCVVTIKRNHTHGFESKHHLSTSCNSKSQWSPWLETMSLENRHAWTLLTTAFRYGHKYRNPTAYWPKNHAKWWYWEIPI